MLSSRVLKIVLVITHILAVRCSGFIARSSWISSNARLPIFSPSLAKLRGGGRIGIITNSHSNHHYDIVVIGGGSGGIACAREASKLGKSVAVIDYVKPSVQGSRWGLGGTCVNVGCIPKKLMHEASHLGQQIKIAAPAYGWEIDSSCQTSSGGGGEGSWKHNWSKLVTAVQDHIHSLNFKYEATLRNNGVDYYNDLAQFEDAKTIRLLNSQKSISSESYVVAVGGRPKPLQIPGGEHVITSDDLFSRPSLFQRSNVDNNRDEKDDESLLYDGKKKIEEEEESSPNRSPPRVLVIGGSYVALECAGLLTGLGVEAVVMHRSALLPGFDQTCAHLISSHMEESGTKFMPNTQPLSITKISGSTLDSTQGKETMRPRLLVKYSELAKSSNKQQTVERIIKEEEFDLVMTAVGRQADVGKLGLEKAGVLLHQDTKQVLTREENQAQTNIDHIYAIGDVVHGAPQLTPVATKAGEQLAQLLASGTSGGSKVPNTSRKHNINYKLVPTTIFTPLEHSTCGLTESDAYAKYGKECIDIYHNSFAPLEESPLYLSHKSVTGYCKAVVLRGGSSSIKSEDLVVGLHYVGPHAGEVMQGFSVALKMGMTLNDLRNSIGIHPTSAENILKLKYQEGTTLPTTTTASSDKENKLSVSDGANNDHKTLNTEPPPVDHC